ncbi:MAG: hypothetical protein ACYDCL_15665 [Myxococcales bacterium]
MRQPSSPEASRSIARPLPRVWLLFFLFVLLAGWVLRFTWNGDMEFKGDESWMFQRAVHVGHGEPWPALGMTSGAGLQNPGLSVWLFVGLSRIFHLTTPLQLDRAVVTLNALALLLLLAFAWRCVPEADRESWLWAGALAAVSPVGLLLQRKIWAQSVLPCFCVVFLWSWWRRDRAVGAFLWGLAGGLLGQIHMSGFFFAAAFAAWTALASLFRATATRPRWVWWMSGSLLALLPLWPWLVYLWSGQAHGAPWSWANVERLTFFRMAVTDALGLGLHYSLGGQYQDFLSHSLSAALPTARALERICLACGAALALFTLRAAWLRRRAWRSLAVASDTVGSTIAALLLFGLLLTAAGEVIYRHYLIVAYPFEGLLIALLALRFAPFPRWWLTALVLAQLGLSAAFLDYIHVHHGAVQGDYGQAYRGV